MTVYRISRDGEVQLVTSEPVLDGEGEPTGEIDGYEGWTVVDQAEGELGPYDTIEDGEIVLDAERIDAELQGKIDRDYADFCLQFVTPGPAMPMIYRDKGEQAKAVLADPDPDPADYPMIAREAAVRGMDLDECALWIESIASDWATIRDLIEPARQAAKLAVTAAATEADKRTAADVDYWAVLAAGEIAGI